MTRLLLPFLFLGLSLAACEEPARTDVSDPQETSPEQGCAQPTPLDCDGRCVDPTRDPLACGSCGQACAEGNVCVEGECTETCQGLYPNQCGQSCVDLRSDPAHCGACGDACAVDEVCSGGECARQCGAYAPDACNGVCVDTRSDPRFCGACDNACQEGELCVGGVCAKDCSGARSRECHGLCVDIESDPRFCGGCDNACAIGEVCSNGACREGCSAPSPTFCGGVCVDTEVDPRACGACDIRCKSGSVCSQGSCAADCLGKNETRCDDACVDVREDPANCGECGNPCPEGSFCVEGACSETCSGEAPVECGSRCVGVEDAAGCGVTCFGETPDLCGTSCVDLGSNVEHCGQCDSPCSPGELCAGGVCSLACGGATPSLCGDECVNLDDNPNHCGECDRACERGQSCSDGDCQALCPSETPQLCGGQCVDLQSDPEHCGVCGESCGDDQRCERGRCVSHVVELAHGYNHACARLSSNEVSCWGDNWNGVLGDPELPLDGPYGPTRAVLPAGVVDLDAGWFHTCARLEDHSLVCWGSNDGQQLAAPYPDLQRSAEALPIELSSEALALASTTHGTCALTANDTVECWGLGAHLGREDTAIPGYEPAPVSNLPADLGALDCGGYHCCVRRLQPSPSVHCWGDMSNNQFGTGPVMEPTLAVEIPGIPPVDASYDITKSLALGMNHACVLGNDGEVFCFGSNDYGQLGYDGTPPQQVVQVPLDARAVAVHAAGYGSCATLEDDRTLCWGAYVLEEPAWSVFSPEPAELFGEPVKQLDFGIELHFAIMGDDRLVSWGYNPALLVRPPYPRYEALRCCEEL